jgi:hypothetical protein
MIFRNEDSLGKPFPSKRAYFRTNSKPVFGLLVWFTSSLGFINAQPEQFRALEALEITGFGEVVEGHGSSILKDF